MTFFPPKSNLEPDSLSEWGKPTTQNQIEKQVWENVLASKTGAKLVRRLSLLSP